jgi:hypothetical protein
MISKDVETVGAIKETAGITVLLKVSFTLLKQS